MVPCPLVVMKLCCWQEMEAGVKSLKCRLLSHESLKYLLSTDTKNNVMKPGDKEVLVMMKDVEAFSSEVAHNEKLLSKLKQMHEVVLS